MRKHIIFLMIILIGAVALPYLQAQDYTRHPGYVDFGNLENFKNSDETIEVFIKGPLLKFVAKATENEDPDLSQLINDLLLIQVNVFEIDREKDEKVRTVINDVSKKLESKEWERMVRVNKRKERAEVFTKFDKNDALVGLVVMAIDDFDDEAVFVNIVGKIDPSQLGKLSGKFNIPEIDTIEIKRDKK